MEKHQQTHLGYARKFRPTIGESTRIAQCFVTSLPRHEPFGASLHAAAAIVAQGFCSPTLHQIFVRDVDLELEVTDKT